MAYLRAHPRFLADDPDLYRFLAPPERVHGEALADHMLAMLRAERIHASAMAERADGVLAAGRAAAGLTARVQEAVLALIGTASAAECVTAEFPALLAVDAASLCVEATLDGARPLPEGMVAGLLGGRPVLFAMPDRTQNCCTGRRRRWPGMTCWCASPARGRRRCLPWWHATAPCWTRPRAPVR